MPSDVSRRRLATHTVSDNKQQSLGQGIRRVQSQKALVVTKAISVPGREVRDHEGLHTGEDYEDADDVPTGDMTTDDNDYELPLLPTRSHDQLASESFRLYAHDKRKESRDRHKAFEDANRQRKLPSVVSSIGRSERNMSNRQALPETASDISSNKSARESFKGSSFPSSGHACEDGTSELDSVSNMGSSRATSRAVDYLRRPILDYAVGEIERHILFKQAFPTPVQIQDIHQAAWSLGQAETGKFIPRNKAVDGQMQAVLTRTRSHVVAEAKNRIEVLYNLQVDAAGKSLDARSKAEKVAILLREDQFTCESPGTESYRGRFMAPQISELIFQRFFRGRRMKGRVNPELINDINGEMLCLISTALYHALKQWQTGVLRIDVEFKADSRAAVYERLQSTWQKQQPRLQERLLDMIRKDIMAKQQGAGRFLEIEPLEGYEQEDEDGLDELITARVETARRQLELAVPESQIFGV